MDFEGQAAVAQHDAARAETVTQNYSGYDTRYISYIIFRTQDWHTWLLDGARQNRHIEAKRTRLLSVLYPQHLPPTTESRLKLVPTRRKEPSR
jgi:hypothetical protein